MAQPSVLVIRGGAIGDFILTLPVLDLLRANIPDARIEVMGNRGIVELATATGHADAHRYLDTQGMAMMFAAGAAISPELEEWLRSFNLVISYLYDPDGVFRDNLAKAGVKTVLAAPHRVQVGKGHAAEQLARPLEELAMFLEPDAAPKISVPAGPVGLDGSPRIAIHPGSGSVHKNWPVGNWASLAEKIQQKFPSAKLAIITGEAEDARHVMKDLEAALAPDRFVRWECLPLPALAANLASCDLFLGHDSGITHLAAACGVRCLALFGGTDPATWAPRGSHVTAVRAPEGDLNRLPIEALWVRVVQFFTEDEGDDNSRY